MTQQFHSAYIPEKNKNINLKRYMHPNVHNSVICNCQDMETTLMSIDRGMGKEDVVHIYTMEYYPGIKKNEIMPFAATWMDLEIIILSEVSQRKTNII